MLSPSAAVTVGAVVLFVCCGGAESEEVPEESSTEVVNNANLDRCALLAAAEVAEAIGAHDGGKSDITNEWGLMGCRWTSNTVQDIEGFPGWRNAIEIAVFDEPMILQWARSEARGDPVADLVDGALFDQTWGTVWFPCPGDRMCVVRAHTTDGDQRQGIVMRLARLMLSRL